MEGKRKFTEQGSINVSGIIGEMLDGRGLRRHFAFTGADAIRMADEIRPDLILVDISLPDISGYEVVREILARNSQALIIAQTAYADLENRLKICDSGCIDYLSKPLEPTKLVSLLQKHLQKL